MNKCWGNYFSSITLMLLLICIPAKTDNYNSLGQVGLINTPSAEVFDEQSIFFTLTKNEFYKLGTITATPFNWMEASYFYYRPDDLYWGSAVGLFLDKGFNVKFSYDPESIYLPTVAVGLDDFAGTGNFTKEYIVASYDFNNFKFNLGLGWGKFVGDTNIINDPLSFISEGLNERPTVSENYEQGGNPSYDKWFRGDATIFSGFSIKIPKIKNLVFKIENNPFDYYSFACCGEGLSSKSFEIRNKKSNYNFGLSYQTERFGNIDLSYIKGDTLNLSISFGFSSKKSIRKKDKFKPDIVDNNFNQDQKNEFYYDLLQNLNANKLYLQTATISENDISLTIDSEEHINPITYSSRAAFITNEVAKKNNFTFRKIDVGQITRGIEINNVSFRSSDINNEKLVQVLLKKRSEITNPDPIGFKSDDFKPNIPFPIIIYNIEPDFRIHLGSPQRFGYTGLGAKLNTEIQLNRNVAISSSIGQGFTDNFNDKPHTPTSAMEEVRTEILLYLQESDDLYIKNMFVDGIWPLRKKVYSRVSFGYLEEMFAGVSTEILYKPFTSNLAVSYELNLVKKRDYDGRFDLLEYETITSHLNIAYYHPSSNILTKWSYGKYLAKDRGYTLDLSRKMPSGWQAGIYFSRTNVSAEVFGEGSFDKGFYFKIPYNVFSKNNSKRSTSFGLKTMTRDGGAKLLIQNRLIDSFYGSTLTEINENWDGFLK